MGEKQKAYENLRIFNKKDRIPPCLLILIREDLFFESISDEP
jgi:hypothetical protein